MSVYDDSSRLVKFKATIDSNDIELKKFANQFDDEWVFGDLRKSNIISMINLIPIPYIILAFLAYYISHFRKDKRLFYSNKFFKQLPS